MGRYVSGDWDWKCWIEIDNYTTTILWLYSIAVRR
jgi:hypothetical protein